MNTVLMLMSSAIGAGGDVIPAGWGENALPTVVQAGGCGKSVGGCDPCGVRSNRAGLLDRLKSKFGSSSSSCGCAPAPAPACNPCGSGTSYYQPNLLDKLKARWGSKNSTCCPSPCPAPCATATPTPVTPPVDTKPKDQMKDPKGETGGLGSNPSVPVAPTPVVLPPLPSTPAKGPNPTAGTNR